MLNPLMVELHDPSSALAALVAMLIALVTARFLGRSDPNPAATGRFAGVDGLRGYLAMAVYLSHCCIWYFYLKTGRWELPPSRLYVHLGQSSVALFFMITAFLFISKIIDGQNRRTDWARLFVSRFLRLVPLYFALLILLFGVVAYLSNGVLNESPSDLARGSIRWLSFTILGAPPLNGIDDAIMNSIAGVVWSLPYEWAFYFLLPLLAVAMRIAVPMPYLLLSVLGATIILPRLSDPSHLISFIGGIAAAFFCRIDAFNRFARQWYSSVLVIACIAFAVEAFPSAYSAGPQFFLAIAFVLMACGSSLFGLLTLRAARTLGDFSYGIYLLHGLVLFIVFRFVLGPDAAKAMTSTTHWLLIFGTTPVLLVISALAFRMIEKPALDSTSRVTVELRAWVARWWPARLQA